MNEVTFVHDKFPYMKVKAIDPGQRHQILGVTINTMSWETWKKILHFLKTCYVRIHPGCKLSKKRTVGILTTHYVYKIYKKN